ncbi:hypothetical protein [Nocardioides montaniterrae]
MRFAALLGVFQCFVLPVGIVVLIVVMMRIQAKRAAERKAVFTSYAAQREWDYRAEDPSLTTRFQAPPFGHGYGQHARNVLLGRHDGRPFVAFDYQYSTSSGTGRSRSSHTYRSSVLAMNLGVTAPDLSVGPASMMGRLFSGLSSTRVEVGDPAFDHDFLVYCPVAEFARDVLTPEVRDVTRQALETGWRIAGDSLLVVRTGQHTPAEVEQNLQLMDALLDRVPPHVWQRLGGEPPR